PRSTALGYRLDALLEAGGIAIKDLTVVEFESSSDALAALAKGDVDCAAAVTNAPSSHILDTIADSIVWLEFPAADKDFWGRLQRALPPALPYVTDMGPGISKSAPKALM